MNYKELVKNAPVKSQDIMWKSVDHVSRLVDMLWDAHQPMARKFMMEEYELMYGGHFDEWMGKAVVKEMWHNAKDGERVAGEVVGVEEAETILHEEEREQKRWDAYVGVNALMHDLARVGLDKNDVKEIAKEFWFGDDDFSDDYKVFWYFKNK